MEAIYLNRKRDLHDSAALVLLDVSYSTDAWIDGRRVLDVIRETVFCVGEVLEEYVEQFGIATFTSNTRRACQRPGSVPTTVVIRTSFYRFRGSGGRSAGRS